MKHRFQINLSGIIELLSDHLYSKPEVFLRELLQNGIDAITARKKSSKNHEGEITLIVTTPKGKPPTLEVSDNGIGLTESEIHEFLATIGKSSKRGPDGLKTGDFLGQFGIGLLSCFVVSQEIVVVTQSAKADEPAVEWRGQIDGTYSVRVLEQEISPGTTVYLTCREGMEEKFEVEEIKRLCRHYGVLLPYPIYVGTSKSKEQINKGGAPWRVEYAKDKDRLKHLLAYGREELGENFLDAIPLLSKKGKVDGVAYVLSHPANVNSQKSHRIYLKSMLLSEESNNLLPQWAFFVKCIVNADDLRPTASREGFYEDKKLESTREELGACLRDYLLNMAENDSRRFSAFLNIHHLALKALAVQDEECYRLFIDWLPFETTQGQMTIPEILEQNSKIDFVRDITTFRQMEKVATAQGITLINAGYVYEHELLTMLPAVYEDLELHEIDSSEMAQEFGELSLEEQDEVHDLLKISGKILKPFKCKAEVKTFLPDDLPALFCASADARFARSIEQSKEKSNDLFQGILSSLEATQISNPLTFLVFNYRNELIKKLSRIKSTKILSRAVEVLYVQGLLLAHEPLTSKEYRVLTEGLTGLLNEVTE